MSSEYCLVTDQFAIQKVRTERFNQLKWSSDDKLIKNRPNHVRDFFQKRQVPFRLLCETKFKRSLFGIFLHTHNRRQVQDYFMNDNKLAMLDYDLKTYSANELTHLECNNNFAPDLRKLLERAVSEKEVIDYDFLYDNIYALRFCDTPLTFLDDELLKFRRLKVLILCGNWLTDIPGCYLPKSLEYIELFANQIEYVHNFAAKGPKRLIHIGLKRNWLTNDSKLHLLAKPHKFHFLQSLDLSDNDIYELEELLLPFQDLKQLMCLQLQGNPCSVVNCYKNEVLRHIPGLIQLDLTEILVEDREIPEVKPNSSDAAITFTCHRIMGLPKPPPQSNVQQLFYFSISMPLLEDVIEIKKVPVFEEKDILPSPPVKTRTEKVTRTAMSKASSGSKKDTSNGLYKRPDEYAEECKQCVVDTTFKTERFAWDRIMQLPEEALLIKSPERNFVDIRDTLRSSVCVKLIYLEVPAPEKLKKSAKTLNKTNQNKKGKKGKSSATEFVSSTNSKLEEKKKKETILKKITLATFECDLHSINWSDKTIDFIWVEQFGNKAKEVQGSLRSVVYVDGSKSSKAKKSPKASSRNDVPEVKYSVPKVFTIHVGFGLQRSYYQ